MSDSPKKAKAAAAAETPARAETMASLQDTLGAARKALEGARPIIEAFPAALAFFSQAYQHCVVAEGAEADAARALEAKAAAEADLAATLARVAEQRATLEADTAAARKAHDADVRGAEAYAGRRKAELTQQAQTLQAGIDGMAAQHAQQRATLARDLEREAAEQRREHEARMADMAAEEQAARDRLASLNDQLAALRARFAG